MIYYLDKSDVQKLSSRSEVKSQGHRSQTIVAPIWQRGALLFLKVICQISRSHETKKSSILTRIGRFRTVPRVWIHRMLWNDAQSLKQHRRGVLSCFKVLRRLVRSHGAKIANCDPNLRSSTKFQSHAGKRNRWFEFYLNKITRPVAAIRSLRSVLFVCRYCILFLKRVHFCPKNRMREHNKILIRFGLLIQMCICLKCNRCATFP